MLLVIARKFNDIFYAISLPEWKGDGQKYLCIISNDIPKDSFPYQHLFNEVFFYSYSGESIINIIKIIGQLRNCKFSKTTYLILSNPVLVTNQYIIKKVNPDNIIMIEDGSINYSSFHPSKSILKKLFQKILRLNEDQIYQKIKQTYLFFPKKGRFYFGDLRKLMIDKNLFHVDNKLEFLNGKKVFVGQPLYNYGYLSLQSYNEIVNKLISDYKIDYYIPHAFSSTRENIICNKILLANYNVTLETIASKYCFEIYSLGSSVLYTCKAINPEIKSNLIKCDSKYSKPYEVGFIETFCNRILIL